uniref:NADP-dependent oxidoreductase domain-containing protein n=1 Tax=Glossina palpalis gambiensis TaxID=67801 RepID=A0A1B0BE41_9MUSC
MSNLAPSVQLNNGQRMPTVGLGTWQALKDQAERAVTDAIDIGYRLIDTAFVYGNEREIGRAINRKIAAGIIKREDIFVTTKLDSRHHTPKLVERACRESLLKLSLDYVDQYLIHFPVGEGFVDYMDTWKAMEKLVDVGLAKGIGLSNFNAKQIDRILENCRIRPVVNQVECHPGFNQKKLIEFCRKRNITIVAYSPLGRPIPAEKWPPFLNDKTVQDIAKNHHKTPVQIPLTSMENEKKVGRAINEKIATGIIKREDIFVITKLDSTHHTPKLVERACRLAFLLKLSLDYVDQYLIRFPVGGGFVDDMDTWKVNEKSSRSGKEILRS